MFLVRTAFWLSLIIVLIPIGDMGNQDTKETNDNLSTVQAFTAAQDTVSDLAGFCDRNPDTCQTGTAAITTFGRKAQYGAMKIYDYLSEIDFGSAFTTGTIPVPGRDTLRGNDRDIPWQEPKNSG